MRSRQPNVQHMKDRLTPFILVVDGDNTLWDTNAVFEYAQLNMLSNLKKENLNIDPVSGFSILREFDDVLVKHYNRREYDFSVLALSLYLFFRGLERDEAIRRAREAFDNRLDVEGMNVAKECGNKFKKDMRNFPPLFDDVKETLEDLRRQGCVVILSSEGDKERVRRIVKYHSIDRCVDFILNEEKSVEQFEEARKLGIRVWRRSHPRVDIIPETIVIGDLLDRDIKFGNLIGATTIYKPGGYKGHQRPRNKDEIPAYEIREMNEVANVLLRLKRKHSSA